MRSQKRVFLAEPNPRYDVSTAERYGDIVYLMPDGCNPFDMTATAQRIKISLADYMFDAESDMFCMTGNTTTIAITLSILCRRYDVVKVLLFDARLSSYREKYFCIDGSYLEHNVMDDPKV